MAQVIQTPKGPQWIDAGGVYDHDPSTTPLSGGFTPPPYDPTDPANIAAWQRAIAANPSYYGALAPTMMPGLAPLAPQAPIAVSGGSINPVTGAFSQTPVVAASSTSSSGASLSLDASGLIAGLTQGSVFGIPKILLVGIGAYLIFFQKKGRR